MRRLSRSLHASERQVARYLAPSVDSVFPLEHVFALVGDLHGRTVLDLGCGAGENALLLARRGARVIAVDVSGSLVELARRRLELNGLSDAVRFVIGSAHELPLAGESIDVVVGIAVLHHLDIPLASREVFRVLKIGGRGVFKEPVRDSRVVRAIRRAIPYRAPDVSPFERPLTTAELELFASPFRTESIRAFCLPFVSAAHALPSLSRRAGKLYSVDGAMLRRFPRLASLAAIRVLAICKVAAAASAA